MRKSIAGVLLGLFITSGFTLQAETNTQINFRKSNPSQKNLIESARYEWQNGELIEKSLRQPKTTPEEVNILAIMVEFQKDDDFRTTGDGTFMMTATSDTAINPPPHNRAYFQKQIQALNHYYKTVSKGQLQLTWHVHPQVFVLPKAMSGYNPGTTDEETNKGLAELFQDAVLEGDNAGIPYSDYESLMIFHAGVGRDIALGLDYTPSDIPSAFMTLDDLQQYLSEEGSTYQGIAVENGTHFITEGMILPETQSQEEIQIGLLGTMTLMFGFQLGLPALWDTDNGRSGIGRWGLMDQGSGNYIGMIPAEPCAWTKIFLGWEEPIELLTGKNLEVSCPQANHPNKIYKVPIHEKEYYLIENRQHDMQGDSLTYGQDSRGNQVTFNSDYSVELNQSDVIVAVDEYDFDLPGSGILIWHIDESVIEAGIADNSVNNDLDRRGVSLVEADGAEDIGQIYGFLTGGYGAENGVLHDAWFEDNNINTKVNDADSVVFGPNTYPASVAHDNAATHIVMSGFSKRDTVMTFDVGNDLTKPGFPLDLGENHTLISVTTGNLDSQSEEEIIITTGEGLVIVYSPDWMLPRNQLTTSWRTTISGDTTWLEIPVITEIQDGITLPPVLEDLDNDDQDELIVVSNDIVYLIEWTENGFQTVRLLSLDSDTVTAISIINNTAIIGLSSGKIYGLHYPEEDLLQANPGQGKIIDICQVDLSGETGFSVLTLKDSEQLSTIIFDMDFQTQNTFSIGDIIPPWQDASLACGWTTSDTEVLIVTSHSLTRIIDINTGSMDGAASLWNSVSAPALADLDNDGFLDISVSVASQLAAYQKNGALKSPGFMPDYERDLTLSAPIIGDLTGDDVPESIVATSTGTIEARDSDGNLLDGFPLAVGTETHLPPVLTDLEDDNKLDLIALSDDGFLNIYQFNGSKEDILWGMVRKDAAGTGYYPNKPQTPAPKSDWLPTNLVYNYPNPAEGESTVIRYRLEEDADVKIRIYDLGGDLVDSFSGPGIGQVDNEITWQLDDVESGVYFCQVKAIQGGKEKTVTIKIAVAK